MNVPILQVLESHATIHYIFVLGDPLKSKLVHDCNSDWLGISELLEDSTRRSKASSEGERKLEECDLILKRRGYGDREES